MTLSDEIARKFVGLDPEKKLETLRGTKMSVEDAINIAISLSDDYEVVFAYTDMEELEVDDTLTLETVEEPDKIVKICIKSSEYKESMYYYTGVTFEDDDPEWYLDPKIWMDGESDNLFTDMYYDIEDIVDKTVQAKKDNLTENVESILETLREAISRIERA